MSLVTRPVQLLLVVTLLMPRGPTLLATPSVNELYQTAMGKFQASDFQGALVDFKRLLEATGRQELRYYIGYCRLKLGHYGRALQNFEAFLEIDPDSWEGKLGLARALFHLGRFKSSRPHFEKLTAIDGARIQALYHLGLIELQEQNLRAAVAYFDQVLEMNRHHLGATYNIGQAYLRLGQAEQARSFLSRHGRLVEKFDRIDSLRKAASFPSSTSHNWVSLGNAYLEVEDYEQAVSAYRKALELEPPVPEVHYHLGYSLFKQGRLRQAVGHYQMFLEVFPEHFEAHFNLGHALHDLGHRDRAIEAFERASQLRPGSPLPLVSIAEIYLEESRFALAKKVGEDLNNRFPRFAHGFFLKAYALYKMADYPPAQAAIQVALQLDPENKIYLELQARLEEVVQ